MRQKLVLKDGTIFFGFGLGYPVSLSGEVVFNTGMVGYPETLTDPSYKNQILVFTYPLVGNYGVPSAEKLNGISRFLESEKIHLRGVIFSDLTDDFSHWNAKSSLPDWLNKQKVAAISGIDTRALTKKIRERGTMPGKIVLENEYIQYCDPSKENPVPEVSVNEPVFYKGGAKRVALIDCGCKLNIIRRLLAMKVSVLRVPWNYTDLFKERFDGIFISNGPGDPKKCGTTIDIVRKSLSDNTPVFGICLGNQILALSAGADTYKLKFGHRSQNQPCIRVGTKRCYITSQNHGYAIDSKTIPPDWEPWFFNANDGTNEGIKHRSQPFFSVQFHPEAAPGPTDTSFLFEEFVKLL